MAEGKLNRSGKKGNQVGLAMWHKPGALGNIFCSISIVRNVKGEVRARNKRYAK